MKKTITIILLIFVFQIFKSCLVPPAPSRHYFQPENDQLKNAPKVMIFSTPKSKDYVITNVNSTSLVWVSHNFKKRSSKEINKEYVRFFCSFKNIETGEYFLDSSKESPLYFMTNSVTNESHGFSGLGEKFHHYGFSLIEKEPRLLPDTITISITDAYDKMKETHIHFFKYSSLYD